MSQTNNKTGESIISALRNYFLTSELLSGKNISIDGLPPRQDAFAIGTMPQDEAIKTYIDKSTKRQYVFELSASFTNDENQTQNAKNVAFFEQISDWLYNQTRSNNLPILPSGCKALKIEAVSGGYFDTEQNGIRIYVCQCRLTYFKKHVTA